MNIVGYVLRQYDILSDVYGKEDKKKTARVQWIDDLRVGWDLCHSGWCSSWCMLSNEANDNQ